MNQIKFSRLIGISLVIIGLSVSTLAQSADESDAGQKPSIITQMEQHMSELQKDLSQISSISDAGKKKKRMQTHFSKIDEHLGLVSTMVGSQRMLGAMSNKRRMQFRLSALKDQMQATLNQMKGHYKACAAE